MSALHISNSLKKLVGLAGAAGFSALLGLPAMAQTDADTMQSDPGFCAPQTSQVTPTDGPTGGTTMEQMQANDTQSMNQSNIGTSTYYGQSLPSSNQVSASDQVSPNPAGGGTMEAMQAQDNQQVNYLSQSNQGARQSYLSRVSTPTNGPAGGYTMERFQEMTGDQLATADYGNSQAYNYNSQYGTSQAATAGPAGGYSAGNFDSASNAAPTVSSSTTVQSRSIYRVGPSVDTSNMNESLRTDPMAGSMSSDQNRPESELSAEGGRSIANAIGGC